MKVKHVYICQQCGYQSPKWAGQCPECQNWNTLVETEVSSKPGKGAGGSVGSLKTQTLLDAEDSLEQMTRISTGMQEFDRVLGSSEHEGHHSEGLVKGSVVLLSGEPGIGKSTILTQFLIHFLNNQSKNTGQKTSILYVNGEESVYQIGGRVRLLLKQLYPKANQAEILAGLEFANSTSVEEVSAYISQNKPGLVIVDSVQTLRSERLSGAAGSFGQLRESTQQIIDSVKQHGIPTILVGHVTKEGTIAGPKILEHMVDCVLELTGERSGELRLLRAVKNRFGATDEVGIFQMAEGGLVEVSNPSALFIQGSDQKVAGSSIVAVMEGTRPLLVEVQSLVVHSQLAIPRRVAQGIPVTKLQVLSAVLEKHARLGLSQYDIYVSVAGGFQVKEPSADLGIALAIMSSLKNKPLNKIVSIGEVGLLGEIRKVSGVEKRIKEAKRLGYPNVISHQSHTHLAQVAAEYFKGK